jgi:hypothetical protein
MFLNIVVMCIQVFKIRQLLEKKTNKWYY